MGNSFGADESYKRHRRSENYRHNRRKLSAEIPQEPTVHGLSFLPDNQKSKWREQTKRRLRISFRRRSLDAESKSPNEDVPTMNGDPLLGTNQCEIISCDMDNRSAQSTPSIQSMDQPSEYSVKDLDQHYFPYQNLILSGGGSKGYAYLGAIKALEDCGIMQNIKRVAGSSAGAICAGLLAVGCSAQEIADVFKCDIKWLFHDQSCACCCGLPRVCANYGVHPAKRFLKIYGEHIAQKVGNPDITFGELYEKYGRELCIVVTNLTRMRSEYCHPKTTPDLPIRTAVRMSMSFPLVYKAVKYELHGVQSLYTDGGMLDQYPIHCFDGSTLELNENTEKSDEFSNVAFNNKSLGLYVVSEKPIDYKIWKSLFERELPSKPTYLPDTKLARTRLRDEISSRKRKNKTFSKKEYLEDLKSSSLAGDIVDAMNLDHYQIHNKSLVDIRNFGEYFVTTLETLLISQRKLHIKPCDVNRTVPINCGYIATNDYDIEPGDREFMIRQGYAHTMNFLQEYIHKSSEGPKLGLRRTKTVPSHLGNGHIPNGSTLRRTVSSIETEV